MLLIPVLVTPPAGKPVSLDEAKDQLRVDYPDKDVMIQGLIDAAVSHLDGYSGLLGRCLVTQTWRQLADRWDRFRLPFPDVTDLEISYLDTAGGTVVVPTSDYRIVAWHPALTVSFGSAWSAPSLYANGHPAITLTMTCGYGAAAAVPAAIKRAILIHVAAMFDELPDEQWRRAYDDLIAPFRVTRV